jgi:hypothetical protein
MKNLYVKPIVDVTPVCVQPLMAGSEQGVIEDDMSKQHGDVVEEDGEETSLVEKEAQPLAFSNNYLKKAWD